MAQHPRTITCLFADRVEPRCPAARLLARDHDLVITDASGSLLRELLRRCPGTVWLDGAERSRARVARVLAAIDPLMTHVARSVLVEATTLAEGTCAELFALHAWSAPGAALLAQHASPAHARGYLLEEHARAGRAFAALLDAAGAPLDDAHRLLLRGEPRHVIPRAARALDVDAVVVGLTQRSWLQRIIFGHTAERIAPQLACHLVVAKAPEDQGDALPLPRAVALRGAA